MQLRQGTQPCDRQYGFRDLRLTMSNGVPPTHPNKNTRPTSGTTPPLVQRRPVPTLGQVKTFAQAVLFGEYAPPEIVAQRMSITPLLAPMRAPLKSN